MSNKKRFSKKGPSKKSRFILYFLLILIGLPALGLGYIVVTFDINNFRPMIEQAVRDNTGREIQLAGKIEWTLSPNYGLSLAIADVIVKNPSWASRPDMARIGKAKLHLDVMALLQKKLNIVAFELSKTDIQLETTANGETNWDFSGKTKKGGQKNEQPKQPDTATPAKSGVNIDVREIRILDSRFGIRSSDGKVSIFEVPELGVTNDQNGVKAHFIGEVAGVKTELKLTGGKLDQMTGSNWPFTLVAIYDKYDIEASGAISDTIKKIVLSSFSLSSGETKITGDATVLLGKARPDIRGKIHSKKLDINELKSEAKTASTSTPSASQNKTDGQPQSSDKLFSRTPIDFSALKSADIQLDIAIDSLDLGLTTMESVQAKLELQGGRLTLAPVKGRVAGSAVDMAVKLDSSTTPSPLAFNLTAPTLDLSQLFKMGGLESAISGKTEVDIAITSNGNSPHAFASHANGHINLLMDAGTISSSQLTQMAGALLQIFAPGVGSLTSTGIKCMAARYVLTNGLMDTKGLLIDTDMTTISGKGYINLPDERIGMSLYTRPKGLGLGGMIPPMRITGDLTKPNFAMDAVGAVQKLTGLLTKNGTTAEDGVPNLVNISGKNTCAATLDNPTAAPAPSMQKPTTPLVPTTANDLKGKVEEIGGGLIKGIFGK